MRDLLRRQIARDLAALKRELLAYDREADLWKTPPGIANSAGSLALHAAGNLRHFVGATLGQSGYVRDRDAEFSRRNVPRAELVANVDLAQREVDAALGRLGEKDLLREYPLEVAGTRLTTVAFLLHLSAHLAYHLGQVDYHRRIVTGGGAIVGALSVPELARK